MAGLTVWNGTAFMPAEVAVAVTVPLLSNDPLGLNYYFLPTGLREDPNHPGLYFPDGLEHDPIAPGCYLIP